MFLVERAGRVMGRFLTEAGDVFFIEPCNNWEGCHVWKHYNAQDIFIQEVEELDTDPEVKHILASKSVFYTFYAKMLDEDKRRRLNFLQNIGRQNKDDVVEFSLKFYYTNQVNSLSLYISIFNPKL